MKGVLHTFFQPHLSQALLDPERDFKGMYSPTFKGCREQTARPMHTGSDSNWGITLKCVTTFFMKTT